jgi:anti-sigma regulatory factor (Ser/Thr protein kinase)
MRPVGNPGYVMPTTCLATSSPATLESARSIRSAVGDAATEAGASHSVVDAVVLCTGEAVTNAALHAYPQAHESKDVVDVVVERTASELVVIVTDFGGGFADARAMSQKGFGLRLIERLTSRYVVSSARDTGTTVRMVFTLRPCGSSPAPSAG